MPKLKAEDFNILANLQMWKHEALAKYIESETGVKLNPVEVALVISYRSVWRETEDYLQLIRDRRVNVEKEREKVSKKAKAIRAEEEIEVPFLEPEEEIKKNKKQKTKVKKSKIEVEEVPVKKAKSKKEKSKKKARTTVSEETVFDD